MEDTRNVIDKYKGISIEEIVKDLDSNGIKLEIAIDNVSRDYNMGTIVRNANAFGVRHVHVIGRKQWNKRGAMATDKYVHVHYYPEMSDFMKIAKDRTLIAVDNVSGSLPMYKCELPEDSILIFGSENNGIRPELLKEAEKIVAIEQFGSTRSINVGVASGIAMYEWIKRNVLLSRVD